jgi:hypothetical protein
MADNDDRSEFWREKSHRARKTHICEECGRVISIGEVYWYGFGKQDGYIYDSKTCEHCRVASDWLLRNCNGFIYGAIIEDLKEHAEGSLPMLRIVVGARRSWRSFQDPTKLLPIPIDPPDMGI